jgi:hypothetical protein
MQLKLNISQHLKLIKSLGVRLYEINATGVGLFTSYGQA